MGRRAHLGIELAQHRDARRAIARGQHVGERPARRVASASVDDATKRVLEAEAIVRPLADLDVRDEPEESPSPVDPTPRVRVIEAAISTLGLAVREPFGKTAPRSRFVDESGAHPREGLGVRGDPLLGPVLFACDGREREVDHLVNQHPVGAIGLAWGVLTDAHEHRATAPRKRATAAHPAAARREQEHEGAPHREATVIRAHGARARVHPRHEVIVGDRQLAGAYRHVDESAVDLHAANAERTEGAVR